MGPNILKFGNFCCIVSKQVNFNKKFKLRVLEKVGFSQMSTSGLTVLQSHKFLLCSILTMEMKVYMMENQVCKFLMKLFYPKSKQLFACGRGGSSIKNVNFPLFSYMSWRFKNILSSSEYCISKLYHFYHCHKIYRKSHIEKITPSLLIITTVNIWARAADPHGGRGEN